MEIKQINTNLSVSGQISVTDIPEIAKNGFKTIICNRPDTEEGAIPFDHIANAAQAHNMAIHFLPVISGALTDQNITDMAAILENAATPVLAYCRTGTRSHNLYQLVQQQTQK